MTECRVVIGPAHLAARAAGARVEVAVGVGVARVVRPALAHRVAETCMCVMLLQATIVRHYFVKTQTSVASFGPPDLSIIF